MGVFKDRTSEEKVMNNGQNAKIIVYNGCNDITVEFEDETIVEHRSYRDFKKCNIVNSNYKHRLGEEKIMSNGQKAKLINYNNYSYIDVMFEDGTVVRDRTYAHFKNGLIRNPNYNPKSKLGEERIMHNGQKATIINYNGCYDVDIEFEDGTKVKNKEYSAFKKGYVRNPKIGRAHV